jgi:hypothetical protein
MTALLIRCLQTEIGFARRRSVPDQLPTLKSRLTPGSPNGGVLGRRCRTRGRTAPSRRPQPVAGCVQVLARWGTGTRFSGGSLPAVAPASIGPPSFRWKLPGEATVTQDPGTRLIGTHAGRALRHTWARPSIAPARRSRRLRTARALVPALRASRPVPRQLGAAVFAGSTEPAVSVPAQRVARQAVRIRARDVVSLLLSVDTPDPRGRSERGASSPVCNPFVSQAMQRVSSTLHLLRPNEQPSHSGPE